MEKELTVKKGLEGEKLERVEQNRLEQGGSGGAVVKD